jgi:hypothetical protein
MKKYNTGIRSNWVCLISLLVIGYGCNDAWDTHYELNKQITSEKTVWELLTDYNELSDFREVLDSVKVMNGSKMTTITYAQLLGQHYFTVFAPVNGSFNKDSLLSLCASVEGNKIVANRFVMNHLARTPYSLSTYTEMKAHLLNGKYLPFTGTTIGGINLIPDFSNIIAKNGVVHMVQKPIPFRMNIYQYLVSLPEFSGMGQYLLAFQKDSLDETASLVEGVNEDGLTVYVDSVFIPTNRLLNSFGYINSEDSTYRMLAPTKKAWDSAYQVIAGYYNYAYIPKADSLKQYWTNFSLMKDLFFNWNLQRSPEDSVISTQYNKYNRKIPGLHVFYKPFGKDGIFSWVTNQFIASNGIVYESDRWPYNLQKVFFTPIYVEAETEKNIKSIDKEKFKCTPRQKYADSISENGYLYVYPIKTTDRPDITFFIPNTLSGKYDVCVIMLPETVYDPSNSNPKPSKFSATLSYYSTVGNVVTQTCRGKEGANLSAFENNKFKVDTITLTTIKFPTCNYNQQNITVSIRLQSTVTAKEMTKYTPKLYIDCFYLKPRQD